MISLKSSNYYKLDIHSSKSPVSVIEHNNNVLETFDIVGPISFIFFSPNTSAARIVGASEYSVTNITESLPYLQYALYANDECIENNLTGGQYEIELYVKGENEEKIYAYYGNTLLKLTRHHGKYFNYTGTASDIMQIKFVGNTNISYYLYIKQRVSVQNIDCAYGYTQGLNNILYTDKQNTIHLRGNQYYKIICNGQCYIRSDRGIVNKYDCCEILYYTLHEGDYTIENCISISEVPTGIICPEEFGVYSKYNIYRIVPINIHGNTKIVPLEILRNFEEKGSIRVEVMLELETFNNSTISVKYGNSPLGKIDISPNTLHYNFVGNIVATQSLITCVCSDKIFLRRGIVLVHQKSSSIVNIPGVCKCNYTPSCENKLVSISNTSSNICVYNSKILVCGKKYIKLSISSEEENEYTVGEKKYIFGSKGVSSIIYFSEREQNIMFNALSKCIVTLSDYPQHTIVSHIPYSNCNNTKCIFKTKPKYNSTYYVEIMVKVVYESDTQHSARAKFGDQVIRSTQDILLGNCVTTLNFIDTVYLQSDVFELLTHKQITIVEGFAALTHITI